MRITVKDKSRGRTEVYETSPQEEVCYRLSTELWYPKPPPTDLDRKRFAFSGLSRGFLVKLVVRDGALCTHCGSADELTVDHIVPLSRGGENELENMQILCKSCNSRKRDR